MHEDYHIKNLSQLRDIIPPHPRLMDKRIKDRLDDFAIEFLQASSLAVFSCSALDFIEIIPLTRLELTQPDQIRLTLKHTQTELSRFYKMNLNNASEQHACTLYCLVSGIGHGLRVNGSVTLHTDLQADGSVLEIRIEQLYFHCSRAIVRGNFWDAAPVSRSFSAQDNELRSEHQARLCSAAKQFISHSSLAFISSQNAQGKLEISPRGDAAGFVQVLPDNTLLIPERPGNKVAITMRNILEQAKIKLMLLIPGVNSALHITGKATLTNRPDYLQRLTFKNKVPKLAIMLKIENAQLSHSLALAQSEIWNPETHYSDTSLSSFPKIMNAHLHGSSLAAKTLQPLVGAIIKHDLKHLY